MNESEDGGYKTFLDKYSNCFEGSEYLKLRFCVCDYLNIGDIDNNLKLGRTLLNTLGKTSATALVPVISSTKVSLLWDIAVLTKMYKPQECVNAYMESNDLHYNKNEGLNENRKIMYEGLVQVARKELPKLVAFYDKEHLGFTNKWDFVLYLEEYQLLTTRKQRTDFAGLLNETAKKIIMGNQPHSSTGGAISGGNQPQQANRGSSGGDNLQHS